jgi:hypothetical protein
MILNNKNPRDYQQSPGALKKYFYQKNDKALDVNCKSIIPDYYHFLLSKYPTINLLLFSLSRSIFEYVTKNKGMCLLCNHSPNSYDFNFVRSKEIWLLTISDNEFLIAKNFIFPLLENGATKTLIIPFELSLLSRSASYG